VASDLSLLILDPATAAVVCERWLGRNATHDSALNVLDRAPTSAQTGLDCWSPVTPEEVRRVAEHSYADGATPEEIERVAARFPAGRFVWTLVRDY